jgi:Sec region non-globular protein
MRISFPHTKSNARQNKGKFIKGEKIYFRLLFIFILGLSITFSNFAQDEDSDILDKVMEEKPRKSDVRKASVQTPTGSKDKKKKSGKVSKKNSKTATKQTESSRKHKPPNTNSETANTGNQTSQQIVNHKLNLEYWVHEELAMSPQNIPRFEDPKTDMQTNPPKLNTIIEKSVNKKNSEKLIGKELKPNPFMAFFNDYKKIIFIFAAIIIFAIYRLRYAGVRDYNNSGRIFSKFRNK